MREIKFRAWTNIGSFKEPKNSMVYGNLDQLYGGELEDNTHFCGGHAVMQYTGLKDKNGKEIYEGDILTVNSLNKVGRKAEYRHVVEYRAPKFVGIPKDCRTVEVIGNIYENPDLLN